MLLLIELLELAWAPTFFSVEPGKVFKQPLLRFTASFERFLTQSYLIVFTLLTGHDGTGSEVDLTVCLERIKTDWADHVVRRIQPGISAVWVVFNPADRDGIYDTVSAIPDDP